MKNVGNKPITVQQNTVNNNSKVGNDTALAKQNVTKSTTSSNLNTKAKVESSVKQTTVSPSNPPKTSLDTKNIKSQPSDTSTNTEAPTTQRFKFTIGKTYQGAKEVNIKQQNQNVKTGSDKQHIIQKNKDIDQSKGNTISIKTESKKIAQEKSISMSTTKDVDVKEGIQTLTKQLYRGLWEGFSLDKVKGEGIRDHVAKNLAHDPVFQQKTEEGKKRDLDDLEKDFKNLDMSTNMFKGQQMPHALFTGADFRSFNFDGATLHNAELHNTNINDSSFKNVDLRDVTMGNVKGHSANFEGADLYHTKLMNSNFTFADFSNTKLEGTNFENTNISGTNFDGYQGNPIWGPTSATKGSELTNNAFYYIPMENGKEVTSSNGLPIMMPTGLVKLTDELMSMPKESIGGAFKDELAKMGIKGVPIEMSELKAKEQQALL